MLDRALLVRFMMLDRAFLAVEVSVEMGWTSRALLIHSRVRPVSCESGVLVGDVLLLPTSFR